VKIRRRHSSNTSVHNLRKADSEITHNPRLLYTFAFVLAEFGEPGWMFAFVVNYSDWVIKRILFDLHSEMGKLDPDNPKFDKPHFESITNIVAAINSNEKGPECYDKMFTESEIEAAIAEAQNHKATGLDKVPNEALTYGGQPIISAFHLLLNFMHNNSLSPTIWAKALVHLIYKGRSANPLDARSYRPISLTSCVSKVFERLLLNRVQDELDDTETLPEEQAGFRPGRSTRDQTYILREALDSRKAAGKRTFLCFVDLSNAFPSAWQDGMWFRLREAGIKGKLFRSIRMLYRSCASAIQTPYGLTD
jgi:hypothetical protein